ncbi:ATPase (AAA+ superfamily)-like protein [Phocaeicola salanitronis DSM 18170]|uniref:ATPase (AAA+ superfamily)-like protein n=1 Tax=Phocaeicola salanitronis (strain DSM 18170 / JCM 13657 / CCUG 60908 / BL78) TaxID=667015 RepID=F0R4A9_PHOSB|nr:ATP-binding protein [Phocaeicola salanitronis]ADY37729.1 ATPase (AAA+ superfamily)-like protein [Phocaeicola salanitronis DSM 18170]
MKHIERRKYLDELVSLRNNGMIKIITGMRRCGKSYLLFEIFTSYLESNGIAPDHIIKVDLEDYRNRAMRNPDNLYAYVESRITDGDMYYILLDEVQMLDQFEDVLNGFLRIRNADIYVTGSNAKFLSKDIITEFRGRGFEVKMYPLSFSEYMSAYPGTVQAGFNEYMLYGGLPQILSYQTEEQKVRFLKALFDETYLKDIKDRYEIRKDDDLEELINIMASGIGALTNPNKLANTFQSEKKSPISNDTVKNYIDYLCDSFLIEKSTRYDIKGKRYINSPYKYYFLDLGLRNARINFRQSEKSHLMENMVYNELRIRGFNVDVGVVPVVRRSEDGKQHRSSLEVDFVCNLGSRRYYIQSAYRMESDEKIRQERASLLRVDDSFKKIIVIGEESPITRDEAGITTISIYEFLLKENSLEL